MQTTFNEIPHWMRPPAPASTLAAMKSAKRWLLHRKKVPHYVTGQRRSGELDSPADTAQLATYEQARQALALNPGQFDGLGFALGGGWQGIDLDKINGENARLALLVPMLPAYVERSPSGAGVHAIGFGGAFDAIKGGGVEAYSHGRYFTFTERTIRDAAPADLSGFVRGVLAPMCGKASDTKASASGAGPCTDADWTLALDALKSIDANCSYDQWMRVGMALASTGRPDAFGHWAAWSATAPDKCPSSRELGSKWASFTGKPDGIGLGTIFELVKGAGWVRPAIDASGLFSPVAETPGASAGAGHPLARYEPFDGAIRPVDFLLPQLIRVGFVVVAGSPGVGKTTNMLPLLAAAAHCCPDSHPARPAKPRRIVWISEEVAQVRSVLAAMIRAGWCSAEQVRDWIKIVDAKRLPAGEIVKAAPAWRELAVTHTNNMGQPVTMNPMIVLDTASACVDTENENDNSEVGRTIATFKQGLADFPLVVVAHTAKSLTGRTAAAELSIRGASAWVADAHQTMFLIAEENGDRFLIHGKPRFEVPAAKAEVRFEQYTTQVFTVGDFDTQTITLRCSLAQFVARSEREQIKADSRDRKREMREMARRDTDSSKGAEIIEMVRNWCQTHGHAPTLRNIREAVPGRSAKLGELLDHLVDTGQIVRFYPSQLHRTDRSLPSNAQLYCTATDTERATGTITGDYTAAACESIRKIDPGFKQGSGP